MVKAAYIRINTPYIRKTLEKLGYTFSGHDDINAQNICTTNHKTYSCVSDYLIDTKDPAVSWSVCREDCGKDIEKLLELCKDQIYEITKVPAERLNK